MYIMIKSLRVAGYFAIHGRYKDIAFLFTEVCEASSQDEHTGYKEKFKPPIFFSGIVPIIPYRPTR